MFEEMCEETFNIALIGCVSSGKSSFLNSFAT